jgi:MbtH protein
MTDSAAPENAPQERFQVVVNHEEQYALWPSNKQIPEKWRDGGMTGTREECLAYVRRVWTDMRPLSVRTLDRSRTAASGGPIEE